MSLSRFHKESDVYVIETCYGTDDSPEFRCCRCSLICTDEKPWESLSFDSMELLASHLQAHRERGHKVEEAFESLEEDYGFLISH